jgi:single-stranded-DNA-specific exonuclease
MESTARHIADHLKEAEFVPVYAYHDADGIAAGAILCHALYRRSVPFRMRVIADLTAADLSEESPAVLCDLGAGSGDLPEETVVIDHHVPRFSSDYHFNPRRFGLDGEYELSASGAAYLIAQEMGDCRDLVGLALMGMLGDHQRIAGKNREIINEGIALGLISPVHTLLLPGREVKEGLTLAIDPYLEGLSGEEERSRHLVEECRKGEGVDVELLISRILLDMAPFATLQAMDRVYGNGYMLERESVRDAHTLVALVDACGRAGLGGLAASLCFRHGASENEAWIVMRDYHMRVIQAIQGARHIGEQETWYQLEDAQVTGPVADALVTDFSRKQPFAVCAPCNGAYRISLRCPEGISCNLEVLARELAARCKGTGGGHETRAGATIEAGQLECFRDEWRRAIAT